MHKIKNLDQFSQTVQLHYDGGKTNYKSFTGCFLTTILLGAVFSYGLKRFTLMEAKDQITVITHTDYDGGHEMAEAFFDENPLYFAWGVSSFFPAGGSTEDLLDYGSVVAYIEFWNDTDNFLTPLSTRKCTLADFGLQDG